jgi:uncharacterized RDD family membrane protein YckC
MPLQSMIAYCWVVGFTFWGYYAGMESSNFQATPGKMIMGLKVTDLDGGALSFSRATARYFSKILSGLPLYAGYVMILFTVRNQGLHDKIAKTQVVRSR